MTPDDTHISYEQEEEVLRTLMGVHAGPWACIHCGQALSEETGWKPQVSLICNTKGAYRAVVDIFCGKCMPFMVATR